MAVTLIEAAKQSQDAKRSAIIETYARSHDILRVMPFENVTGGVLRWNQEGSLPSTGFRGLNEGYTESSGALAPKSEQLTIAGGDLDVDVAIVEWHGQKSRTTQELMKTKSLAHTIGHKFVKGDSLSAVKEFDGLQVRSVGNQLVANGASPDGDVLSLAKLDELIDTVDNPTHLIMSKAVRRSLTVAARTTTVGGNITHEKDEFGRQITMYNDLPILIADPNSSLYATLAFDEANPGGGSNVGTSIYCVSFQPGMLVGIQSKDIDVRDLGELATPVVWRTRVEWYVSIAPLHPRSFARLWGIKAGAVVA